MSKFFAHTHYSILLISYKVVMCHFIKGRWVYSSECFSFHTVKLLQMLDESNDNDFVTYLRI